MKDKWEYIENTFTPELDDILSTEKRKELEKAVRILRAMFSELEETPGEIMVGLLSKKEVITVVIRGACYDVNVECCNVAGAVKMVVERTINKY